MYSGWSPFFRTKFWKKEFVGSGFERRFGEKKLEGSGTTVESTFGNRKGECFLVWDIVNLRGGDRSGGNGVEGDRGGDGVLILKVVFLSGLEPFLKPLVRAVLTLRLSFFNIF